MTTHAATDVGRVRQGNEDRFLCGHSVLAVADGLGGHPGGEVAAALAIAELIPLEEQEPADERQAARAVTDAVRRANAAVRQAAHRRGPAGMATTLTAVVLSEGVAYVAHVGDTRAYRLHDGALEQLTVDHTPPGELLAANVLDRDRAAVHPERHLLTRALGLRPDVQVDAPPSIPLSRGDRLLLCSDGLSDVVDEQAVVACLQSAPPEACQQLIHAALDEGGPDNVTVVVAAVA